VDTNLAVLVALIELIVTLNTDWKIGLIKNTVLGQAKRAHQK
jgi:hypothetical protein